MPVDPKKWHDALVHVGEWNGSRCTDIRKAAEPAQQGAVIAAAIGMSMLATLQDMAKAKALYPKDLQIVMDAFFAKAEIVETYPAMGGLVYESSHQPPKENAP
jgi:hypothetical protein